MRKAVETNQQMFPKNYWNDRVEANDVACPKLFN